MEIKDWGVVLEFSIPSAATVGIRGTSFCGGMNALAAEGIPMKYSNYHGTFPECEKHGRRAKQVVSMMRVSD